MRPLLDSLDGPASRPRPASGKPAAPLLASTETRSNGRECARLYPRQGGRHL